MKIVQIFAFPGTEDFMCHWDATSKFPTLESTEGRFAPDILFVEAPDYVFEGWGFDMTATGDARFVRPPLPQPESWTDETTGRTYHWAYDDATGTFYIADEDGNPIHPDDLSDSINALHEVIDILTGEGDDT
jgi:hypothetical protein